MTSVLTGFADASAWERRSDGTIVGRARNGSWAERVRTGVPIDAMMDSSAPEPESCVCAQRKPVQAAEPSNGPYWRGAGGRYENWMDEHVEDEFIYGEYVNLFPKEADEAPLRLKRTSHKLAAKPSAGAKPQKYGPKQTKMRTVAAKILAEPVEASVPTPDAPAPKPNASAPALPRAPSAEEVTRFLGISLIVQAWLADMAEFADDIEITEQDIEDERMMQRIRDARYER